MIVGKGYIIQGPTNYSPTIPEKYEAVFKGIPNNGIINVNIGSANICNLVGNPYPSTLDADVFLNVNKKNIKGTLYFWTHNTPYANNKYTQNDYAVYNRLGGVGTRAALTSGINETVPDGKIASGQAFFVGSLSEGTIEFNNSMRTTEKNSIFFKPEKINHISSKNVFERHRIWLNLKNSVGIFKQLLIGYIEGATNLYDSNYDAESFNANQFVDFYSNVENKKLVIQGRGLPFVETDSIPLGYSSTIDGEFSISIDHKDGIFENRSVFINDKDLNITYDLSIGAYTFSTKKGTFKDRFNLKFVDENLKTDTWTAGAK